MLNRPMKRDGPGADVGAEPAVEQIGRQVHGDEGELEAAGEEAEHQQHVAAMAERLAQRLLADLQLDGGGGAAAGGVASTSDSGSTSSIMPAKTNSAVCQEKLSISPCASGENRNWPNEPAAVPAPNANDAPALRHELAERADHHRERAAGKPKADDARRPTDRASASIARGHADQTERVEHRAGGQARAPGRNDRRMLPANGCAAPQSRFCSAIANENASRPQPRSNDIGDRNWPSAERGPKAINAIAQPTAISTIGVRQETGFSGAGAIVDDIAKPRHSGAGFGARSRPLLSGLILPAKAKVADGIDLRAAWLHGCAAEGDWRPAQ